MIFVTITSFCHVGLQAAVIITGSALAQHCCKAHAKINGKIENSTPCKIVIHEDFNLKLGTRDYVADTTHHPTLGSSRPSGDFPPNRGNITLLWLFCYTVFFALRSNHRTDSYAEWLKWRVSAEGSAFWESGRWVTSYGENIPQKGAWIGSFKPKRQNYYIAISPELLIRRSSDLRTEFRPRKAFRGWSVITPKQIQHGWRRPSWKSIWRHISAADVPIWRKFGSRMQNDTPITAKWSRSKPEVEFQYGGRLYLKTGSSYISAANWDILTKFGLLITFDLLKAVTSTNTKPEVVFSGRGRLLEKWIWRHISSVFAPIWTKFGSLMQNNMQLTGNWSRSKPEVEFQYGERLCLETGSSYTSATNGDISTKFG